jgi:hypothetical protein
VVKVDLAASATLADSTIYRAGVVMGAVLRSFVRTAAPSHQVDPVDTSDIAFRMTFLRPRFVGLNPPVWNQLLEVSATRVWLGPLSHVIC